MAETFGELVVQITSDYSKLNEGLKKAGEAVKKTTAEITEYTNKIGMTVTAVGAVVTAAYGLMIKSSQDYAAEIYKVHQQTNIAVETLNGLRHAADQTESSFEAVATSFKFLNRNIYEAENGNIKAAESFRTLGIALRDEVTGNVLKADDVFLKIADRFKNLTDESAKTALAMEIFGRQGAAIIPILNLGSDEIHRLFGEINQLRPLTEEEAEAANKLGNEWDKLKKSLGGLFDVIVKDIRPALEDFIKKIIDIMIKIREWSTEHPKLSKAIAEFGLVLGVVLLSMGTGLLIINQFIKAMQTLTIIMTALKLASIANIFTVIGMGGFVTDIGTLVGLVGVLFPLIVAAGTAFATWKVTRFLSEITGLDELLSGPDGLFTKMFSWLDKNEKKLLNIQRVTLAISTMGLSEVFRKEPGAPAATTGAEPATPGSPAPTDNTALDQTVNLLAIHAEKLKTINEAYLSGKSTAEQYYNSITQLMQDGIDKKQIEMDLINQSIELQRLSTDAEYARIAVMQESAQAAIEYAQVKAQMQNQDLTDQAEVLQSATNLLNTIKSYQINIWADIFNFINMGIKTFSKGMTDALSSIILGTKSGKDAFQELGQTMIKAIVDFWVEWAVQALIAAALGKVIAATTMGIANSVAAAWLPAAVFASVATFGGAAAAGAAGLTGAALTGVSLYAGMKVAALAEGGIVTKPTVALIGEAGPEAVVPLNGNNSAAKEINIEINLGGVVLKNDLDIDDLGDALSDRIERNLRTV